MARATACTALLCALTFANCRAVSLCPGDAPCDARGGSAGSDAEGAAGGEASGATGATGGTQNVPIPPPAGNGGATAPSGGSGGATPSTAGEGGAAPAGTGAGGETGVCEPHFESCDDTWLNGCEVDLRKDPLHCGHCDSICDGLCSQRGCHEMTPLLDASFQADLAVTADYVYVLTGGGSDGPVRLWRVDKFDLSQQLLAEDIPWFSDVVADRDSIYLYSPYENLWTRTGEGEFIDEGFKIDSIASSAAVVYADRQGTLVARNQGESTWTPQPWLANEAGTAHLLPIDVSDRLCVLREFTQDRSRYEIFLVDRPDLPDGGLVTLASGYGEVVRIRGQDEALYWLIHEESGLYQLLRRELQPDSKLQVLATGPELGDDFALDSSHVYLTRSLMFGHEFEVVSAYPFGTGQDIGVRFDMSDLESDGEHLWFFAWDSLQRIELPIGEP